MVIIALEDTENAKIHIFAPQKPLMIFEFDFIDNDIHEGGPIKLYWYEYNVNTDNLYTFVHDEPEDDEEP